MPVSENTILKEAQRLARADGKTFGRLPMIERREYIEKARAARWSANDDD